ncbi:uncharacterized protein LOC143858058 [Tasmannia lanceolata]|uniref:uncharacterized protein LOC143858058 n=1 Tax=Tasmannia lanceolata TaxID=3420 RepID=UPI004062DF12
MKTLISENFLYFSNSPFSIPHPLFNLRSFAPKKHPFLHFPIKRFYCIPNTTTFCPLSASNSSNYNGWDDLELSEHSQISGFVSSMAISRVRFSSIAVFPVSILVFVIGFSIGISNSMKEVSRNGSKKISKEQSSFRVSSEKLKNLGDFLSELDFKISDLKSGMEAGFSSNRVGMGELKSYLEKINSIMLWIVPMRNLVELSIDNDCGSIFDGRVSSSNFQLGFLQNVSTSGGELADDQEVQRSSNQKSIKRKKDSGVVSFDFVRFLVGGLFQENSIGLKPNKVKNGIKRQSVEQLDSVEGNNRVQIDSGHGGDNSKREFTEQLNLIEGNDQTSVLANRIEERDLSPVSYTNIGNSKADSFPQKPFDNPIVDQNRQQDEYRLSDNGRSFHAPTMLPLQLSGLDGSGHGAEKSEVLQDMVKKNSIEMGSSVETVVTNENILSIVGSVINEKQFNHSRHERYDNDLLSNDDGRSFHRNNDLQLTNKHGSFKKKGHHSRNEVQKMRDVVHEPAVNGVDQRSSELDWSTTEPETSLQQEKTIGACDTASLPSHGRKKDKLMVENGSYGPGLKQDIDKTMKLEDQFILGNCRSAFNMKAGNTSSSSKVLNDGEFNRHLKEAGNLLKQTRECLTGEVDEERAEIMLHESASLLSRAIAMKPKSLQAVGQLGNTFLLHGELKLKISRELRIILSRSDSFLNEKEPRVRPEGLKSRVLSKDKVVSALVDVCEECEELLVEAGRKYRMALSIDGNDVRALYNWGLALSFRAQLIADVGPDAAFDADKLYLAAIDKFDAMLSKSNIYAPDALFRWGVALQQRSQMRPSSSKEKMKLLYQAKRLFEDSLQMDSNNFQVREALSSCISELN